MNRSIFSTRIMRTSALIHSMLALFFLLLLLAGCTEDKVDPDVNEAPKIELPPEEKPQELPGDVTTIFKELETIAQTFDVDAGEAHFIEGKAGGTISIPANSLVDGNGTPVDGGVRIEFIEIYTIRDMILSNKPTVSDGQLLLSGGEFYINITQEGEPLQLAEGKNIFYSIPTDEIVEDMILFVGDSTDDGSINWTPVEGSNVSVDGRQDNEGGVEFAFYFEFNRFGWINCDKFFNDPRPKTDVFVTVPEGQGPENTAVFIAVRDELSVLRMYWDPEKEAFRANNLPIGLSIFIVGIAELEEEFFFAIEDPVIEENQTTALTFEKVTLEAIEETLDGLGR